MNEFSRTNLWSNEPSTLNDLVRYVPWYTTMFSNDAVLLTMLPRLSVTWDVTDVMLSGIENT